MFGESDIREAIGAGQAGVEFVSDLLSAFDGLHVTCAKDTDEFLAWSARRGVTVVCGTQFEADLVGRGNSNAVALPLLDKHVRGKRLSGAIVSPFAARTALGECYVTICELVDAASKAMDKNDTLGRLLCGAISENESLRLRLLEAMNEIELLREQLACKDKEVET